MVELLLYGVVQTHGAYILCGWTVVFWGRRANEPVAPVEMYMYGSAKRLKENKISVP